MGLKELEILHTQIFANHLEFGNNPIQLWNFETILTFRYVRYDEKVIHIACDANVIATAHS